MRLNPEDVTVPSLDELIPAYYENKQEYNSYEKLIDRDNQIIKELMEKDDINKYVVGNLTATLSIRQNESMDEVKLLQLLKEHNLTDGIIKTTEYIDMDELERAMYSGKIPEEVVVEMDKCKIVKETKVLKVTRKKEKKNG